MRWVYVTGCDSGFGRIMVDKIRSMPGVGIFAGVFLPASLASLQELDDPSVVPVLLDVTDEKSVSAAAEFIQERLGGPGRAALYGLCNNAGILVNPGPVEWTPVRDYKKMMAVNVFGMADVTRSVLPMIRRGRDDRNTASMAGRTGPRRNLPCEQVCRRRVLRGASSRHAPLGRDRACH